MNICLVNLKFEKGNITFFRKQEHLGLAYIASACQSHGHVVDIINAQYDSLSTEEVLKRIDTQLPKFVGVSLYEELLDITIEFLKELKESHPDILVAVGGHYASFNAINILKEISYVDYVMKGEGEISFPQVLDALDQKQGLQGIRGVCYRSGNEIVDNGFPETINELDELILPYRAPDSRQDKMTNISASRGCNGSCSFCSTSAFQKEHINCKAYRIRSPKNVVDEIESLIKNQNAYHFFFTDDNFFITEKESKGWITEFADEIKKRNLKFVFNFDCRVDDVEENIFRILKEAGLIGVFLGVESNSPKTLKLYSKRTTTELNKQAISILRKVRIDYWIGNIMFHPLTTMDDILEDIKFFKDIRYTLYFNYSNPVSCLAGKLKIYSGTPLYKYFMSQDILITDNLACNYKFQDKRTELFYDFVLELQKVIQPLVEYDPIHIIDVLNQNGQKEQASRVHTISRKYMKWDFDKFVRAHAFLTNSNSELSEFKAFTEKLLTENIDELKAIEAELLEYDQLIKGVALC